MPDRKIYEYAVLRFVPRVEREEFINIGVVLYCKDKEFLAVKTRLDESRLKALFQLTDLSELMAYVSAFHLIANGDERGGAIAGLDQASRFRWLTAKRSTIVQISPIHSGLTLDPDQTLMVLFEELT
jgi:hypothetical protein